MKYIIIICSLFSTALLSNLINYQGLLSDNDGNPVENSIYSATFSLFDSENAGNELWNEEQSFITSSGVFNIELGSITPFGNLNFSQNLWLEIHIQGEATPLSDRIRLGAVPSAKTTNSLINGAIDNSEIGGVTPSSATFTDIQITSGVIEASSATINLSSANFGSSTLYVPNSINSGAVLTSDGNGRATWQALPSDISLSDNEIITGNWDNSQNPWSDSEVANDLTITEGTINNTQIGDLIPNSATFTFIEVTANQIEASSATINLSSANFGSATLYVPNSINSGAVLTSDGNGKATWQENQMQGGVSSNTFYEYIRHYRNGITVPAGIVMTIGNHELATSGFDNRYRFYQLNDSEVDFLSFHTDVNAGSTTFRIYKNGTSSGDLVDFDVQTQSADTEIIYQFSSATFEQGDYYFITFESASNINGADWNITAAVKNTP